MFFIIIQVQIATGTSLQQPTTVFQNKGLPIQPRLMSQDINPITMCSIGQEIVAEFIWRLKEFYTLLTATQVST